MAQIEVSRERIISHRCFFALGYGLGSWSCERYQHRWLQWRCLQSGVTLLFKQSTRYRIQAQNQGCVKDISSSQDIKIPFYQYGQVMLTSLLSFRCQNRYYCYILLPRSGVLWSTIHIHGCKWSHTQQENSLFQNYRNIVPAHLARTAPSKQYIEFGQQNQ